MDAQHQLSNAKDIFPNRIIEWHSPLLYNVLCIFMIFRKEIQMIELKKLLAEKISEIAKESFGASLEVLDIISSFEYPPDDSMGDLAYPCFKLSPILRKGPNVIAQTIAEKFDLSSVAKATSIGGYLNFFIADD